MWQNERGPEISAEGVVYDKGSVHERIQGLQDLRKAGGKRPGLTGVLTIVLLAKLSGADAPTAMTEWGMHHQSGVKELLRIKLKRMPIVGSRLTRCTNEETERRVGSITGQENVVIFAL